MIQKLLCTFILLFCLPSFALNFPTNIVRSELDTVVELLGFGTSTKFMSDPYPLGGYSGLEVGVSMESINIEEISRLGDGLGPQNDFRYNRLSIGKGLYKNIDAFAHFVPYSSSAEVTDFGGLFKWSFYQGQYLPFSASALAHLNTTNIQDKFANQNIGFDLMLGVNVNRLALYIGGGYLRARSIFMKDILDTTDPELTDAGSTGTFRMTSTSSHSFVGVQVLFTNFFLIGQIDRYDEPVYSMKLGYRM